MPVTSRDKDYILRMIQQIAMMVGRLITRKKEGDLAGALQETHGAVGTLLGPMAEAAQRVDSATAAHMVGDPDVIAAWAGVVAEEADVWRLMGDAATADALERRALELALEAHARFDRPPPALLQRIASLRAMVDAATLAPPHRDALAAIQTDEPDPHPPTPSQDAEP